MIERPKELTPEAKAILEDIKAKIDVAVAFPEAPESFTFPDTYTIRFNSTVVSESSPTVSSRGCTVTGYMCIENAKDMDFNLTVSTPREGVHTLIGMVKKSGTTLTIDGEDYLIRTPEGTLI